MSKTEEQQGDAFEGLGIAGFLMAGAALFVWAPSYFDATSGWRKAWYALAIVTGFTGFVGGIVEIARLRQKPARRGSDDIAIALVIGALAIGLYVLERNQVVSGILSTASKGAVLLLAFISLGGLFLGVGRLLKSLIREPERQRVASDSEIRSARLSAAAQVLALLAALVSLAAALLGLARVTGG